MIVIAKKFLFDTMLTSPPVFLLLRSDLLLLSDYYIHNQSQNCTGCFHSVLIGNRQNRLIRNKLPFHLGTAP